MKVIEKGYVYELAFMEGGGVGELAFIHKDKCDGVFETVHDGTTNEEVLAVLIDRLYFLNNTLSCRENSLAITKCEEALMWLEKRAADRVARGVGDTPVA